MSHEFEELKAALKRPPTPEAVKAAADAFRRYQAMSPRPNSRPMLVSLGAKKGYPTSVPVERIPEEMERNPSFFKLIRNLVTKEK